MNSSRGTFRTDHGASILGPPPRFVVRPRRPIGQVFAAGDGRRRCALSYLDSEFHPHVKDVSGRRLRSGAVRNICRGWMYIAVRQYFCLLASWLGAGKSDSDTREVRPTGGGHRLGENESGRKRGETYLRRSQGCSCSDVGPRCHWPTWCSTSTRSGSAPLRCHRRTPARYESALPDLKCSSNRPRATSLGCWWQQPMARRRSTPREGGPTRKQGHKRCRSLWA